MKLNAIITLSIVGTSTGFIAGPKVYFGLEK